MKWGREDGCDLLDDEGRVFFWSITEPDHRVSAFLAWVEGLPVSMVNQISPVAPACPSDVEALVHLEQRLERWHSESAEHSTVVRHLELRIRAGGWSSSAQAAILRAATVFVALEPTDRDLRGVHLNLGSVRRARPDRRAARLDLLPRRRFAEPLDACLEQLHCAPFAKNVPHPRAAPGQRIN